MSAKAKAVGSVELGDNRPVFDAAEKQSLSGLILVGVVKGRSRKEYPNKETGEVRTHVTYTVDCNGDRVLLSAWSPDSFFTIEQKIAVKVAVNVYTGKGGVSRYGLNVFSEKAQGETF